jgi:hypothetical protein
VYLDSGSHYRARAMMRPEMMALRHRFRSRGTTALLPQCFQIAERFREQ